MKLIVSETDRSAGRLRFSFDCNPTRTLSHLLALYADQPFVLRDLAALTPPEFFASAPVGSPPSSLDGKTNWLNDVDAAYAAFGTNPFATFLPVYVAQLQNIPQMLLGAMSPAVVAEGSDHHIFEAGFEAWLEWGAVRVPQIESYFERYHGRAISAVRSAAHQILTSDHQSVVRRYSPIDQFERDAGSFSVAMAVGTTIPDAPPPSRTASFSVGISVDTTRKLAIYAKSDDRIRFEVRRHGRGRYDDIERPQAPADRLLAIIASEKASAATCCRWHDVFHQFDDADFAGVGDLIEFLDAVAEVCAVSSASYRAVLTSLLVDGGISPATNPLLSASLCASLVSRGVVERTRLRTRERRARDRYSLVPRFRGLREVVMTCLGNDAGDLTEHEPVPTD